MRLWEPKHHTKDADQSKLRRADILTFFICIYVYTNLCYSNNLTEARMLALNIKHFPRYVR